jgi:hypothetical protein
MKGILAVAIAIGFTMPLAAQETLRIADSRPVADCGGGSQRGEG